MVKLRIEGLPNEVLKYIKLMNEKFDVLCCSKNYKNRNSKYVRAYMDIQQIYNKIDKYNFPYFICKVALPFNDNEFEVIAGCYSLDEAIAIRDCLNKKEQTDDYFVKDKDGFNMM